MEKQEAGYFESEKLHFTITYITLQGNVNETSVYSDMPSNYNRDAKSAAIKTSGNENISVNDADRAGGQHGTTNICPPPQENLRYNCLWVY
jgi:hypothetical protein